MSLFASLAHRPFLLLWSGQTLSRLGDSLYQIALAWWVLEQTNSAAAMGMVFACGFAPTVLFVLLGGVAVDRLPRIHFHLSWSLTSSALLVICSEDFPGTNGCLQPLSAVAGHPRPIST